MNNLKDCASRLYVALRDNDLERARRLLDDPDALDVLLHLAHALAPHDIGGSQVRHSLAEIIDERAGAAMGRAMLDRVRPVLEQGDSLASLGVSPSAVYVMHGEVRVSCGESDDRFASALRRALGSDDSLSAGMLEDLRDRTALANARVAAGLAQAFDGITHVIERNAPGWQEGESDDERARRLA